jgi:hypothetical protein
MHVMRYRLTGPFGSIFRVHVPDVTRPSDFYEQMTLAPSTYSDSGDDQGRALASGDFVTVTRYPNDRTQYLVIACSTVGGRGPGTVSYTRSAFDALAGAPSTSSGASASDTPYTPPPTSPTCEAHVVPVAKQYLSGAFGSGDSARRLAASTLGNKLESQALAEAFDFVFQAGGSEKADLLGDVHQACTSPIP